MRLLISIILTATICLSAAGQTYNKLSTICDSTFLAKHLIFPAQFFPIPTAKHVFWRDSIPWEMRKSYIDLGEKYIDRPWNTIPLTLFAEYKSNGNRTNFENRFMAMRKKLSCLVMAEIMEHQGRFIGSIIDGVKQLNSEIWWGVPAHYPTSLPKADNQVVELFSAETANLVAWTLYMLHDELNEQEPGISEYMKKEIQRRILIPALTNKYTWKKSTTNWNPWICSNWLSCILFCEDNRLMQLDGIRQILQCLDIFYDNYPDDGSCDEGIMYWNRSAASFFECLYLLGKATNYQLSLSDDPKLKNMGAFCYNIYVGNRQFANFSDAQPNTPTHPNISLPFGLYTNDSTLQKFALWRALIDNVFETPSILFEASGNFPTLSRELLFLHQYPHIKGIKPEEPHIRDVWLPFLQLFTARDDNDVKKGLYVAAKGGHNGESHNHNDVGNFIVYKDAEPLIIDIGVGTYTAQTFSNKRYELFNCRSAFHNVPTINGCEQKEGKTYRATNLKYKETNEKAYLLFDIAHAYPSNAGVKKWQRTICLNRGKNVTITEHYKLHNHQNATELNLICCGTAKQTAEGEILIDNGRNTGVITFSPNQLSASIEEIVHEDYVIQQSWKRKKLYRIKLTIRSKSLNGEISYSIM